VVSFGSLTSNPGYGGFAPRFLWNNTNLFPALDLHDLAAVDDHFDRSVVDPRYGPENLTLQFRGQPAPGLPFINPARYVAYGHRYFRPLNLN